MLIFSCQDLAFVSNCILYIEKANERNFKSKPTQFSLYVYKETGLLTFPHSLMSYFVFIFSLIFFFCNICDYFLRRSVLSRFIFMTSADVWKMYRENEENWIIYWDFFRKNSLFLPPPHSSVSSSTSTMWLMTCYNNEWFFSVRSFECVEKKKMWANPFLFFGTLGLHIILFSLLIPFFTTFFIYRVLPFSLLKCFLSYTGIGEGSEEFTAKIFFSVPLFINGLTDFSWLLCVRLISHML